MSEDLLKHFYAHGEGRDQRNFEAERAVDYGNKWESRLQLFRRSEAAQFLESQDPQAFRELLGQLTELVYEIQVLAPYLSSLDPHVEADSRSHNIEGGEDFGNVDYYLRQLTQIFQYKDGWLYPNFLGQTILNPAALRDHLSDEEIDVEVVKNELLSTEQWRKLYERMPELAHQKPAEFSTGSFIYQQLLQALPGAHRAVEAIAKEVGVELKRPSSIMPDNRLE